jgi:hypothetical protein
MVVSPGCIRENAITIPSGCIEHLSHDGNTAIFVLIEAGLLVASPLPT